MMDKWEAQYKALAMGITDKSMIDNAVLLVEQAQRMSTHGILTFDEAFYAILQAVGLQQAKEFIAYNSRDIKIR